MSHVELTAACSAQRELEELRAAAASLLAAKHNLELQICKSQEEKRAAQLAAAAAHEKRLAADTQLTDVRAQLLQALVAADAACAAHAKTCQETVALEQNINALQQHISALESELAHASLSLSSSVADLQALQLSSDTARVKAMAETDALTRQCMALQHETEEQRLRAAAADLEREAADVEHARTMKEALQAVFAAHSKAEVGAARLSAAEAEKEKQVRSY